MVSYQKSLAASIISYPCSEGTHDEYLADAYGFIPRDAKIVGAVSHDTPGEDDYTLRSPSLAAAFGIPAGCKQPAVIKLGIDSSGWSLLTICGEAA